MDIGRMGSLQPGMHLKGFRNASSGNNSPAASGDSFTPGDNSSVKHNDLKKAADLLMKKNKIEVKDEWSVRGGGTPSVVNEKHVLMGSPSDNVRALDITTGEEKWNAGISGSVTEGKDGSLFVSGKDTALRCLDPETGNEKWNINFDSPVQVFKVGDDGAVYARTPSTFYEIDPQAGEIKWQLDNMGTPAIADDGKVFISDGFVAVKQLDRDNGSFIWMNTIVGSCQLPPTTGKNGDLYVAADSGIISALDQNTGKTRWRFDTEDTFVQSPLVGANGDVLVNNGNQNVYAFDPETGNQKWFFNGSEKSGHSDGQNNVKSFAAFGSDGSILFAGGNRSLGLNSRNGKVLWEKNIPSEISAAPIQDKDGRIFLACSDKKTYAIKVPGIKDLLKEGMAGEIPADSAEENPEIKKGDDFVDIGGVRLKVNK